MPQFKENPDDQLLSELRAELASSQAALQAGQNDLSASQGKLQNGVRDLAAKQQELYLAQTDVTTLRVELAAPRAILQAAQAELASSQNKLKVAEQELTKLRAANQDALDVGQSERVGRAESERLGRIKDEFLVLDRGTESVLTSYTDITERKQAEEALLKAGALQSAIFNSANFSSIATDAKGVIQRAGAPARY